MSNKVRKHWAGRGSLVFEGQITPPNAKHLNLCAGVGIVPEDIYEWTMDLRYSWGRQKTATSAFVLRACDFLEFHIYSNKTALLEHLRQIGPDPSETCQDLLNAFILMRDCAEAVEKCSWTLMPVEGEANQALRSLIPVIRLMETEQRTVLLSKEQEEALFTWSDEAKINFINSFTDSINRVHGNA